eukprot:TRINITY_DN1155_c0_g1_i5.p1 TRINITY_DN1155_c0_g1~~TRINITY_DN1155_c0_g1_i5.p1  ORF type:complete len:373 (-),score=31.83 TRINITY_DN1155_c0_g1_i5:63-1181(-)
MEEAKSRHLISANTLRHRIKGKRSGMSWANNSRGEASSSLSPRNPPKTVQINLEEFCSKQGIVLTAPNQITSSKQQPLKGMNTIDSLSIRSNSVSTPLNERELLSFRSPRSNTGTLRLKIHHPQGRKLSLDEVKKLLDSHTTVLKVSLYSKKKQYALVQVLDQDIDALVTKLGNVNYDGMWIEYRRVDYEEKNYSSEATEVCVQAKLEGSAPSHQSELHLVSNQLQVPKESDQVSKVRNNFLKIEREILARSPQTPISSALGALVTPTDLPSYRQATVETEGVNSSASDRIVVISDLPKSNVYQIFRLFSIYGNIGRIKISKEKKVAFVEYKEHQGARKALHYLNNITFLGSQISLRKALQGTTVNLSLIHI